MLCMIVQVHGVAHTRSEKTWRSPNDQKAIMVADLTRNPRSDVHVINYRQVNMIMYAKLKKRMHA